MVVENVPDSWGNLSRPIGFTVLFGWVHVTIAVCGIIPRGDPKSRQRFVAVSAV